MRIRDFTAAGHWPTLLAAFLYFDASFLVWLLFGALANTIAGDFALTDSQKGLLVAVPLLGGALLRLPLGLLADRVGGRPAGLIGMALTIVPLVLCWLWAEGFSTLLAAGLLLGIAGGSFAVALPLASRWYPPQYQGLVMGIAGAGNSGTVLAALLAPRLADAVGWHGVFGIAALLMAATMVAFALLARDSPNETAPKQLSEYWSLRREKDVWWFAFFYGITFGGFVGLASFLGIYFHDQYGLDRGAAGTFTAICVVAGSFLRPAGGYLADRFGGIRVLRALYVAVGAVLLAMASVPPLAGAVVFLFVGLGLLGMGNGAVFQLVPQRFGREIGIVTGVVGAAGGLGGFLLPVVLGSLKQATGAFSGGFVCIGLASLTAAGALLYVSRAWQLAFLGRGGIARALVPVEVPVEAE